MEEDILIVIMLTTSVDELSGITYMLRKIYDGTNNVVLMKVVYGYFEYRCWYNGMIIIAKFTGLIF